MTFARCSGGSAARRTKPSTRSARPVAVLAGGEVVSLGNGSRQPSVSASGCSAPSASPGSKPVDAGEARHRRQAVGRAGSSTNVIAACKIRAIRRPRRSSAMATDHSRSVLRGFANRRSLLGAAGRNVSRTCAADGGAGASLPAIARAGMFELGAEAGTTAPRRSLAAARVVLPVRRGMTEDGPLGTIHHLWPLPATQ